MFYKRRQICNAKNLNIFTHQPNSIKRGGGGGVVVDSDVEKQKKQIVKELSPSPRNFRPC